MKLLGIVLLVGSLTLGVLAAATAYLAPLDLPTDELEGLTLAADARGPAGKVPGHLFKKGQKLTAAVLATLRAENVSYVLVHEFSFTRWPGRWVFLGAAAGLLLSASLLRSASRRHVRTAGATEGAELPDQALRAIQQTVDAVRRDVLTLPDDQGPLLLMLERLGQLQRTHMPAFVESRPLLIARLGLGGYAELMDRYAAAERQINRAWSAAADGVLDEAVSCLDEAAVLLQEAAVRLAAGT
jgi:hypothetical protein